MKSTISLCSFLFFLGGISVSCNKIPDTQVGEQNQEKIVISLQDSTQLGIYDRSSNATLIPLETTDECLLGEIKHIKLAQNSIFVLTAGRTNGLYQFSLDGKFIQKFLKKGGGPEEYGYIENFDISGNKICLLDSERRRILECTTDGKLLNVIQSRIFALDIQYHSGNFLLYCGNNIDATAKSKLICIDNRGNKVWENMEVSKKEAKYLNITPPKVFSMVDNQVGLLEPFASGIVYFDSNGSITKKAILDFGKYNLPESIFEKPHGNIMEFLQEVRKERSVIIYNDYFENAEILSMSFEYGAPGNRYFYMLNKTDKTYTISKSYIDTVNFNEGLSIPANSWHIYGSDDKRLVFGVSLADFLDADVKMKTGKTLSPQDNPIVYIVPLDNQ